MPGNMLIHDMSLEGRTPTDMAPNNWDIPAGTATAHVMGWAAAYAVSQRGLDNLFVMCHGYEGGVADSRAGVSTFDLGFGLALGTPGLTFENVRLASGLSGHVATITLFACGPAHTRSGFENTSADGMRFCGELALISGAAVVAAIETQYYYHTPTWWDRIRRRDGVIDFGSWEGPVFRFSPVDGRGSRVI